MKKMFLFPIFILALLMSLAWPGTAIKKSGVKDRHNWTYYLKWDFDTSGTYTRTGAAAGTNTDTLVLYADSATTTPFYTTAFTTQGMGAGVAEPFPDSIKYCVEAHDDAADAITLRSEFQYKLNLRAATWTTFGGNGDLALAGAGVHVQSCFTRQFFPGRPFRIVVHPTTTTDSAVVNYVTAFPVRK